MTLAGLSIAYLRDRALNTALNILLLALGVATMVILLLFSSQLEGRFTRDAQGIDLVVGAKGSPLQLILSSIYHIDVPTGNVPADTVEMLRRDPTVAQVIPLALGDSFRTFRIVGTEPAYPAHYGATLAGGTMFAKPLEATIGSEVASRTGATLGQRFVGSHGLGDDGGASGHDQSPFTVVGILKPTGTVVDRLILTPVESVWDAHGIEHDHAGHSDHTDSGHRDGDGHDAEGAASSAAREAHVEPEVTALLVTYRSSFAAVRLPNFINKQTKLQAAAPSVEITRLLSLVGIGFDAVRAFAVLLMLTAGLSIFVALYTALRQREGDMAMLRVIGATPTAVLCQILLEGLVLAGAGALIGVALGHGIVGLAAAMFGQLREMGLSATRFETGELWIVAGALGIGLVAALLPAIRVIRADIADTLAHAR